MKIFFNTYWNFFKKNIIKYTSSLTYDGVLNVVNNCEENAIKEIIRITHADRINDFIDYDFNGYSLSKILMLFSFLTSFRQANLENTNRYFQQFLKNGRNRRDWHGK